jgi:cell division protein FtsB
MSATRSLPPKFGYTPLKQSIDWLIRRLRRIESAVAKFEYERMTILISIEENRRWEESKKYKNYTWSKFLAVVCPRFGNTKYQASKRLLRKYGPTAYQIWGPDRVTVIEKYAPYEKKVMRAGADFIESTGRIPTAATLDRLAQKATGIRSKPRLSEIIDTKGNWVLRCRQAQKECKKLKKENAQLKTQVTKLAKENSRLRAKLNGDFAKKLKKLNKLNPDK